MTNVLAGQFRLGSQARKKIFHSVLICAAVGVASSLATADDMEAGDDMSAGVLENFAYPLSYSTEKMDTSASPGVDWAHYANGKWYEVATIPDDGQMIAPLSVLGRQVDHDLGVIVAEAAEQSGEAEKGTPLQQVGDLYTSGMDTEALEALGVEPLDKVLADLGPLDSPASRARAFAKLSVLADNAVMMELAISPDPEDRSRYGVYIGDADLSLGFNDVYLSPQYEGARGAVMTWFRDTLVISGLSADEAEVAAEKLMAWETRIAAKKLTPVQYIDPNQRFIPMPTSEVQELLSNVDLEAFAEAYGAELPERIVVVQKNALVERNALLGELSPDDLRLLLRWRFLQHMTGFLTPELFGPAATLNEAFSGQSATPPREQLVTTKTKSLLPHPISQLYVDKHFSAESKADVEAMLARIRGIFRERLVDNDWLTPPTHEYALGKLDKTDILVGYPEEWIDYRPVDVRPDDYFGNATRINTYISERDWSMLGGPVKVDRFSIVGSTLPIDVNAAFNPSMNGIEIPAAFLQPPFYDPNQDPVANTCAIGSVIGHELTHGFDTRGRDYDADGTLRDWWTPEDAENLLAKAQILIDQADAFEVLPGLNINGTLTVAENIADLGGLTFATQAVAQVLEEHPEAREPIDGLGPYQRCYLAWAQLWPTKKRENTLRQTVATEVHPDGNYRIEGPVRHMDEFYEAFPIDPEDHMWIAPEDRARIW